GSVWSTTLYRSPKLIVAYQLNGADEPHHPVDDATWAALQDDPKLERFYGFWTPLAKADQVVPALGCSTPTFHGSAADLAYLSGSFVSLLAGHIGTSATAGTHLIESSHARSAAVGGHHYIPFVIAT